MSDDWGNSFFETLKTKESTTMSKLVEITSKTGKCLCKGCPIFTTDAYASCPISENIENITLHGEKLPEYEQGNINQHMWCDFKYCRINTKGEEEIKNNTGYRVTGPNGRTMWVPGSIVTIVVPKKREINKQLNQILPLNLKRFCRQNNE